MGPVFLDITVTLGDATENMVDVPLVIAAEEGDFPDAEITYDPNVVQLHDIAADASCQRAQLPC